MIENLQADTKSNPDYVLLLRDGEPILRQAKVTSGKRFRQGTNPDYNGFFVYSLEYKKDDVWLVYDKDAPKNEICHHLKTLLKFVQ